MDVMRIGVQDLLEILKRADYIADRRIAMAVYLAIRLEKPLLVEGEPGTGKTELAKALAAGLGTELIRIQCYEGLDFNRVIYEWDYPRQLVAIRLLERALRPEEVEREIYSEKYLLKRPLLRAATHRGERPPVLLIDEIDRADEEFEALFLEFLSEFQITIPEIGTIRAQKRPIVIMTSNRTREVGDGLRRRSLYLYLTYPERDRELEIVRRRVPGIPGDLAGQVVDAVRILRGIKGLSKKPGISEAIDWARALVEAGHTRLTEEAMRETMGAVLKLPEDMEKVVPSEILGRTASGGPG